MQRLGFVHDIVDVKCLILFVLARANYPASGQQIYELCYQDDCLSYFDVFISLPQLVASGHLREVEHDLYEITDKGRADESLLHDSIAPSVARKAENAVNRFNRHVRRSSSVKTKIDKTDTGEFGVVLSLQDDTGKLMTLELSAPNQRQAIRLCKLFEKKAERIYNNLMADILDDEDEIDD